MIDKDTYIITKEDALEQLYGIIKCNTPQIAIAIPILTAIITFLVQYYFYMLKVGYYQYFYIDAKYMLLNDAITLFEIFTVAVLTFLYWGYAIFSVRIFMLAGNWLWKILCFLGIPFGINFFLLYEGNINIIIILVASICIVMHWGFIWILGFCFCPSFHRDKLEGKKSLPKTRKKLKPQKVWKAKEYLTLGVLVMLISLAILFFGAYKEGNALAENEKRYGIVRIDNQEYAVIDANEETLILQMCERYVNTNELIIQGNSYRAVENDTLVIFGEFDSVKVVE